MRIWCCWSTPEGETGGSYWGSCGTCIRTTLSGYGGRAPAQVRQAPRSRRPYLAATLAVEGRTLDVVGVHPSSPSPSQPGDTRRRNSELDHIAEVVKNNDAAVIVAGDFNTTPWSPHFGDLLAAAGLRNAAEGKGYIPTWPTWFWPARIPIDHVLLKGPIAVTTVRRGPTVGSDHFPIIADLRLISPS